MKTLPDYLEKGLKIVSIGLNPSIPSVEAGFYFANPRNRFWKALNASALISESLTPGRESNELLFKKYKFGFTDVVKRSTRGGSSLRAADFKQWAPELHSKLKKYQPKVAWFHGVDGYRKYLLYGEGIKERLAPGEQQHSIGETRVYVTPNPSPANAVYSLQDLIDWYNKLGLYLENG